MVKKVLAVEDDVQIANLLKLLLESPDLLLLHYTDGEEGWHAILEHRPDLIILDVMLPSINGWEIFDRVRAHEQLKTTPIIVLSVTQPDSERRRQFSNSNLNWYVSKPFDVLKLRRQIKEVLAVHRWEVRDQPIRPRPQTGSLSPIAENLLKSPEKTRPLSDPDHNGNREARRSEAPSSKAALPSSEPGKSERRPNNNKNLI